MSKRSNTTVRFMQGVPFDNNYAHTRWFTTKTEQFNYFNSFSKIERTQNNFQKSTGRMAIDVSEHVEKMMNYDYMMYKNNDYGNKWFYAFILNVEYLDVRTTRIYFEIDPIQTYMFDVDIKPSYVLREHESTTDNIYPENLQSGGEYETVHELDIKPYPFYFMVIVTKQAIHETVLGIDTGGTVHGLVDPFNYYVLPISRNTSQTTRYYEDPALGTGYTVGGDIAGLNLTSFLQNSEKAVNNVVSIYVTDYLPINVTNLTGGHFRLNGTELVTLESTLSSLEQEILMVRGSNYISTDLITKEMDVGNVFSEINESTPKLRYYPYTIIEVSDARGNIINYKPEGFLNENGDLTLRFLSGLTHQNTVAAGLVGYNGAYANASFLETAIINTDPQDLPVLNNQTASYLQGAKNSMQAKISTWESSRSYQKQSVVTRGVTGAGKLLGAGVGLGGGQMNIGYGINAVSEGVGGIVQSALDHRYAGEEYQNKIVEQNAQVEDLMNVPPSLEKQGNNPSFNVGYNLQGVRLRIKRVRPQYLERIRSYLHMFGTTTNRLKVPNLRTRTHYNYVQTTMLNVQSNIYNDDVQRFKQIFDSGITLWHTNDIYNYNVANNKR